MPHDEVIAEIWRIKDEIAAECNYDIHVLAASLRADEEKHRGNFVVCETPNPLYGNNDPYKNARS